ncbi:uncharacterized protein LOC143594070 [Bidens hawaiensis]|uniref:uncharacterized protein LOC143594070 n=1 Tax=Bidens hawaiensis TaxID=980011 RepID=UPI0040492755
MAIEESCLETLRSTSMAPPVHYILNIQQFSLLTKQNVERYESNEFEATGYKWKLVIHPNGNKSKNVGEFLSAYLAMADSNSLPLDYTADEMSEGGRFQRLRTERGFDKFISLKELGNSNIGYLVGDKKILLHLGADGPHISLKLALADLENLPSGTEILAEFTLRMRDQSNTRHKEAKASNWFSASEPEWGWQRFISHATFVRWFLFQVVFFVEADVVIHGERTVT